MAKQEKVVDYLSRIFPIEVVDKVIDDECGDRVRPDIVMNPKYSLFKVVVEVDEHQHKSADEQCKNQRMVRINEVFKMPTLIIRYNPYEFKSQFLDYDTLSDNKRLKKFEEVLNQLI